MRSNTLIISFSLLAVLSFVTAGPSPDKVFFLQQSTFTPKGCTSSFQPTSILRQVPNPFACFSRCSDRESAAYSQHQDGVLCACGDDKMISGLENALEPCSDDTWFLFHNDEPESEQLKHEEKRDRLMPLMMMRKTAMKKKRM
ncbi:hypothetical protein IAU60_004161 [Kwoniella sp. DSM 27419]